ncbi:MAG: hypothetical protein RIC87_12530 [Kiloniellales bacterium]
MFEFECYLGAADNWIAEITKGPFEASTDAETYGEAKAKLLKVIGDEQYLEVMSEESLAAYFADLGI